MIYTAYTIASSFRRKPDPPERDPRYLKFIRGFSCVGCGTTRRIEAMHVGPRGLGQKASDKDALPGCVKCHRTGPKALHKIGPVKFQVLHKISFADQTRTLQELYQKRYPNRVLL